ncbi:lysylphosphatidylglycerol synthase domain-containing protein, partial [Nocardioides sp. YIM 152588]|uniref:lysylphosphatidylglycerol synthase domain-containing protein n=1 Tax=Nocardioides sp. YIM 152588 TaxID=3158259 RepID=UPI0032E38F64
MTTLPGLDPGAGAPGHAPAPASRTRAVVRVGLRLGVPAVVLAVLVQRLGAGPFLEAFDLVTPAAVAAAVGLVALTTAGSAWRWRWVARRLDLPLGMRGAVAAYYRSQLLNQLLPGGILGDVHRAVRHGDEQDALGRAARAVAWERALGQVGLVALTLLVVGGAPGGVLAHLGPAVLVALGAAGLLAAVAAAAG